MRVSGDLDDARWGRGGENARKTCSLPWIGLGSFPDPHARQ
jgi:hypothetical protein